MTVRAVEIEGDGFVGDGGGLFRPRQTCLDGIDTRCKSSTRRARQSRMDACQTLMSERTFGGGGQSGE